MPKIRVLLIEQNRLLREHMSAIIRKQSDITLVAVAATLRDVALKSARLRPHIALIDLDVRRHKTLDFLNKLHELFPSAKPILNGCSPGDSGGVRSKAS